MSARIPRIVGTICAFMVVLEVSFVWFFLSEACDGALKNVHPERFVPLGELLLAVAPFGFFPLVTPVLVGVLYWRFTTSSTPRGHDLIFPISLSIMGLIALAICAEHTKQFAFLDGGKSGSVAAWVFNGILNGGMLWMIQRSWSRNRVEHTVAPKRSLPPSQNSTSPVRGSEDR